LTKMRISCIILSMFYSIIASAIVSSISIIGLISAKVKFFQLNTRLFVALSAGALIGDVFIHILPEVIQEKSFVSDDLLFVIVGILAMFVLEAILKWQHCHEEQNSHHHHHLGKMSIAGNLVHNFIDGIVIASSFAISTQLGLITTMAIILHEIPHEFGNYMVLIHSGFTHRKAVIYNLLTALAGLAGTITTGLLLTQIQSIQIPITTFAAGTLLYIAMSDLIPEVHNHHNAKFDWKGFLAILVGIGMLFLLRFFEFGG
jgi:zinc and cadmium transporter